MNIGDIVTVVTPVGEVIGKLVAENDVELTLEDPRLFVAQEGSAGLAPGICMTGAEDPKEAKFFKGGAVAMTLTANPLVASWRQQTSGLVVPS
jgi:hypothetical protein